MKNKSIFGGGGGEAFYGPAFLCKQLLSSLVDTIKTAGMVIHERYKLFYGFHIVTNRLWGLPSKNRMLW